MVCRLQKGRGGVKIGINSWSSPGGITVKFEKLIDSLEQKQVVSSTDLEITGICCDSRLVKPGDLFVAIPGFRVDGHMFIGQALERGAAAVVAERSFACNQGTGAAIVEDARLALSALSDKFYGSPSKKLKLVGITGTNGKTTISFLIKAIVEKAGHKTGIIGTAGMLLGSQVLEGKSDFTTPEAHSVHRLLGKMVKGGASVVAMEVSSHALEQRRVDHCRFDVAVYSNLTHEHLDYHRDMESYFAAKAKLFQLLHPGSTAVINLDDPYGARMVEQVPAGVKIFTYGFTEKAMIRAENLHLSTSGSVFRLVTPEATSMAEASHLFGAYNVSNALAAVAAGIALGFPVQTAVAALQTAKGAPGRFEQVDCGQDFTVVVDYAHTPDGFEKMLYDVVRIKPPGAKIIIVFGSAGHRDSTKRPHMGRIAGNYCDVLVLTEEDPRTEDALEISRQIASGINRTNVEIHLIEDRVKAINYAISKANPGDIVLVTGKGNETRLEVQHPTNWRGDVPAVVEALQRLRRSAGEQESTAS